MSFDVIIEKKLLAGMLPCWGKRQAWTLYPPTHGMWRSSWWRVLQEFQKLTGGGWTTWPGCWLREGRPLTEWKTVKSEDSLLLLTVSVSINFLFLLMGGGVPPHYDTSTFNYQQEPYYLILTQCFVYSRVRIIKNNNIVIIPIKYSANIVQI